MCLVTRLFELIARKKIAMSHEQINLANVDGATRIIKWRALKFIWKLMVRKSI